MGRGLQFFHTAESVFLSLSAVYKSREFNIRNIYIFIRRAAKFPADLIMNALPSGNLIVLIILKIISMLPLFLPFLIRLCF
jgi:hypothetical protein